MADASADNGSARIIPFTAMATMSASRRVRLLAQLDRVFFESSATRDFADNRERAAFRERWLGRYLIHFAGDAFVALDEGGGVAGYLAGCLDSAGALPLFADVGYYAAVEGDFAAYPAHLHVNVGERWRGGGIGGRLVEAFASHCVGRGIGGIHAVTSAGSRAARFYQRCGFTPVRSLDWQGRDLVVMGRRLATREAG